MIDDHEVQGVHTILTSLAAPNGTVRLMGVTAGEAVPGFGEQLRDQAADGDLDVDFAGFDSWIWPHLARADVVLVPSRFDEPFGTAAVEAVLALRPVIASNSSGLREAAGGYSTIDVSGWSTGPTVSQCSPFHSTSLRTSKPRRSR